MATVFLSGSGAYDSLIFGDKRTLCGRPLQQLGASNTIASMFYAPLVLQVFWGDFMFKCRLAGDVFFPVQPEVFNPARAVKSRLQMILVSDRSGRVRGGEFKRGPGKEGRGC